MHDFRICIQTDLISDATIFLKFRSMELLLIQRMNQYSTRENAIVNKKTPLLNINYTLDILFSKILYFWQNL